MYIKVSRIVRWQNLGVFWCGYSLIPFLSKSWLHTCKRLCVTTTADKELIPLDQNPISFEPGILLHNWINYVLNIVTFGWYKSSLKDHLILTGWLLYHYIWGFPIAINEMFLGMETVLGTIGWLLESESWVFGSLGMMESMTWDHCVVLRKVVGGRVIFLLLLFLQKVWGISCLVHIAAITCVENLWKWSLKVNGVVWLMLCIIEIRGHTFGIRWWLHKIDKISLVNDHLLW